ncbi:bifunctional 3'-5' exonuclease/DNA polymerase [Cellulomonas marina]|uniref:DNA-directed DNA polymerase n=1 Tax=Cellulomonas marina TaxID=988821 RepID=A0A1I0WRA0_9CELL|nr:bifunctional 3'-5' exonuclease/DNA polymerase [Cellulomonas marina]GIG27832.1 bifunctional 3'-5' exonuclease/DNA polymerase [Cellulomonas marina]SFA91289.1 DNA polymerase-1 [Cellulomonas marina]
MPYVVLAPAPGGPGGGWDLVDVDDEGTTGARARVAASGLAAAVAAREAREDRDRPRWVWDRTALRYPPLLAAGVRVERCHDLALADAVLRASTRCTPPPHDGAILPAATPPATMAPADAAPTLFDAVATEDPGPGVAPAPGDGPGADALVAALRHQLAALATDAEPGRLRLLLAAESSGALVAAEMEHDGLPWDVAEHDRLLTGLLGPRPPTGRRPAGLEALADEVREALSQPALNPDSQPELLAALRRAGCPVASTSRWEVRRLEHPVREPLLAYKKLSRLLGANGWAWMDRWVREGRFRAGYVVAGVVSGRWATSGGGALQLPKEVRGAVRADPGWRLVVADAAQLEPRVLAAMSGDRAMAAAGRHRDLYQGVVDAGTVATRDEAKYAMLGAIYGATSGAGGALMPRLTRAYPQAVALVEDAARAGERGEVVTTWLGRSSPPPGPRWRDEVAAATDEGSSADEVRAARRRARDQGRFTRNFVVQGTAAEWALCWLASLRRRLRALPVDGPGRAPHLVFFLHDEVLVHTPAPLADAVADAVRAAADEAGRLLFGAVGVEFALDVAVVGSYDEAP